MISKTPVAIYEDNNKEDEIMNEENGQMIQTKIEEVKRCVSD